MPTQIAQVNDFTTKASEDYLHALQNARNSSPLNALSTMLNLATKANESQKLTDTVDAYNRAMEAGKSASEALQGLDPRMTGSKAFKDEADKIRASILNQAANNRAEALFKDQMKHQAMRDQADALTADYMRFRQEAGPAASFAWFEKHPELEKNPIAYKSIMSIAGNDDITKHDASTSLQQLAQLGVDPDNIEGSLTTANDTLNRLSGVLDTDVTEGLTGKTLHDFIKDEADYKQYKGGDRGDWEENVNKAYNVLKPLATKYGLPEEVLLAAIKRNTKGHWANWLPGGDNFQDVIDLEGAKEYLGARKNTYMKHKQAYLQAKRMKDILEPAVQSGAIHKADVAYQTDLTALKHAYDNGKISAEQFAAAAENAKLRRVSPLSDIIYKATVDKEKLPKVY